MKKSRLLGGQSSSDQASSTSNDKKYHDYFGMKIMLSLINLEVTIEDSEVSVEICHQGNHFQKIHASKSNPR